MSELMTPLSTVCICGHAARKHHPPGHAHAETCSLCSCLYMETSQIADDRPIDEALMDAIRCSTHIEDRRLRARYVIEDLRLRGWSLQRVTRDLHGRFARLSEEPR